MSIIADALKRSIRFITQKIVSSDRIWIFIQDVAIYGKVQREVVLEEHYTEKCKRYFIDRIVSEGPFNGIVYPTLTAYGSAIYPKLLGTYESELHEVFSFFKNRYYKNIVDIGFAEGYYLIGLALQFPNAQLWGFDISAEAHRMCFDLARENKIPFIRLRLSFEAKPETLKPALLQRSLVVCDCEGFERSLFDSANLPLWANSDLVIECHDFINPNTTTTLTNLLSASHNVRTISSVSSHLKAKRVCDTAKSTFSEAELIRLVSEGRPCSMNWIIALAKTDTASHI